MEGVIFERIRDVLKRISHAALRAGRSPDEVTLVAVTKGVSVEAINEALEAGLRVFGENRVQETLKKQKELVSKNIIWHMIGHLQRNKARQAVGLFDLIHSVDSLALSEAINRYAAAIDKTQRILIEVKLSPEPSKTGISKEHLPELISEVSGMPNLRLEGLMTMPPYSPEPEHSRPYYRELRGLAKEFGLKELSMGMSGDFEVAIEEGATMVRVGSAIFGGRR